jgi:hypothetical protein
MATALRILCVHGVGQHPPGGAWQQAWEAAIHEACRQVDAERALDIQYCHYDDIFAQHKVGLGDTLEALARLLANGITAPFRRARGDDSRLRHTAGMVVKWVESPAFRKQTRDRLVERIEAVKPHVVLGHSLGSLVCYDTFTHEESRATASGRYFVSLGSQIGNPFVRGEYQAGRLSAIEKARFWYHLYNRFDSVFTARVSIAADNFRQVDTHFDIPGNADHAAEEYLRHPQAVSTFWYDVLNDETARITRALREQRPVSARVATPRKRALLIGINDYPDPDQRLAGCVNDVFLMSAMLQEQGFDAGDIRVVLDERATADGIRKRVDWLLDGVRSGDQRILYYSGHGAQLPTYGLGDRVDRMDETLVPYDFDWTEDTALTDDWLFERYVQLPYDVDFSILLDCCHSGGMAKGGPARMRGLNPPDDIRHRALKWDAAREMWVPRELEVAERKQLAVDQDTMPLGDMSGRLGYALPVRTLPLGEARQLRKALGHKGPYMPLLVYACQEGEFAYEYEHGAIQHGAFTYALVKNWRRMLRGGAGDRRRLKVSDLVKYTSQELHELEYDQTAALAGPEIRLSRWM